MMKSSGMTLLELVVSMAIFVLVAGAGYAGLQQGTVYEKQLKEQRLFWRRLESVFNLMQTDLDQASRRVPRTIQRTDFAFLGNEDVDGIDDSILFSFTRGGIGSFREGPVSPYERVTYRMENGTLYRAGGPRIGGGIGDAHETAVLDNISAARIRYLISRNQWADRWPQSQAADPSLLPKALEIRLTLADHGSYRWLFHVGTPR